LKKKKKLTENNKERNSFEFSLSYDKNVNTFLKLLYSFQRFKNYLLFRLKDLLFNKSVNLNNETNCT
jgi:hypothetical protein